MTALLLTLAGCLGHARDSGAHGTPLHGEAPAITSIDWSCSREDGESRMFRPPNNSMQRTAFRAAAEALVRWTRRGDEVLLIKKVNSRTCQSRPKRL